MSIDFIITLALIALIPGLIAYKKGRSFIAWYIFGVLFWIAAIIAIIVVDSKERPWSKPKDTRKCPHCSEEVEHNMKKCNFCGKYIDDTYTH